MFEHKLLFLLFVFLCGSSVVYSLVLKSGKIDSTLVSTFHTKSKANIVVNLKGDSEDVLKKVRSFHYIKREDRINHVVNSLKKQTETSQKSLKAYLDKQSIKYKSFWITNKIIIEAATATLTDRLANFSEVTKIQEEIVIKIGPVEEKTKKNKNTKKVCNDEEPEIQWGIKKIQADLVWEMGYNGTGIVVGGIDTGVRYSHEVLENNFRSCYAWRDPINNRETPYDDHGHGTHTMATIVGSNGIGVAPGAEWIACKGCGAGGYCSQYALLECGEFMLCPTKPDGSGGKCGKAPHLVSNSWGGSQAVVKGYYGDVLEAWLTAGIIPIFSIGNDGYCESTGSPGNNENAIGVGSVNDEDSLSWFSSMGPTTDGRIKPDISVPGSYIKSASYLDDDTYTTMSGTSMACPHAAGAVALILSTGKSISYPDLKTLLFQQADNVGVLQPTYENCGNVSESSYPNNAFGHGRINAYKSVISLLNMDESQC